MKNATSTKFITLAVFIITSLFISYIFANWDEFKRGLRGQPLIENNSDSRTNP